MLGGLVALNLLGERRRPRGRRPRAERGRRARRTARRTRVSPASRRSLAHYGHPVSRQRGALADAILDPTGTVFVIEPQTLTDADDTALLAVRERRRPPGDRRLRTVLPAPPPRPAAGLEPRRRHFVPEIDARLGNLREVEAAGRGSWTSRRLRNCRGWRTDGAALVTESRVGRGEILFVADASPLENAYLGLADNAAFALGLAGDAPRPVEFVEGVHGYGESRGLGAIPTPWKMALIVLAAAAVVLAWSRSRRFGPPDRRRERSRRRRAPNTCVRSRCRSNAPTTPSTRSAPMQQWARSHIATARAPATRRVTRRGRPRRDRARVLRVGASRDLAPGHRRRRRRSRSAGSSRSCRNTMGERRERAARPRGAARFARSSSAKTAWSR